MFKFLQPVATGKPGHVNRQELLNAFRASGFASAISAAVVSLLSTLAADASAILPNAAFASLAAWGLTLAIQTLKKLDDGPK